MFGLTIGQWVTIGVAAAAALFILWLWRNYRVGKLTVKTPVVEVELERKEKPAPALAPPQNPPAGSGTQIGVRGSVAGPMVVGDYNVVTVLTPAREFGEGAPPIPPPHGYIPQLIAPKYIPRGIEAQVRERLLSGNGVAAIVGLHAPGGVGKTELAKVVANELKGKFVETFWVDLNDKTPEQVAGDFALKVGLSFTPNADYHRRILELQQHLAGREWLIVLDDARKDNLPFLNDFALPPPCGMIVTSRIQQVSARIPADAVYRLDRMTQAQARDLLEATLGAERVKADNEAADRLMERCKFNPLALDIAARRIRQLEGLKNPITVFAARLQSRLDELKVGDDESLNLWAVFDLSYDDLSPADQARFRRLAAFASSGFSPAAAAAVWGDDEKMANESVARLVNLSLLKVVEGESERYRLHDLLDEYAGDKLRASGELDAANRAHAEFLIALFDEHFTDDPSTAPEVAPELDNLRAAANWATKKREGNVLALLAYRPRNWLYIVFRINEEWLSWLTASLAFGVEDRGLQANVLQAIGDVQQFRDDRDAALASYEEALRLFRAVGDKLGEANVRKAIGDVQQFRKEMDAALASYEEALRLFRAVGDRLGEANVLQALGDVQSFRKDNGAALESYRQALELFRAVGARLGEANVLKALGDVQSFRDERDAALESYRQALELFRAVGDRLGEANVRLALGGLKRRDKNIAGARADFEGALRSYRAIGDRYSEGRALYRLGDCAADEEKWEDALAAYRQAAELWQGIGLSELAGQILTPKIVDAEKQVAGKG